MGKQNNHLSLCIGLNQMSEIIAKLAENRVNSYLCRMKSRNFPKVLHISVSKWLFYHLTLKLKIQKAHLEIYEIQNLSAYYHQVSTDSFIPKEGSGKDLVQRKPNYCPISFSHFLSLPFVFPFFSFGSRGRKIPLVGIFSKRWDFRVLSFSV